MTVQEISIRKHVRDGHDDVRISVCFDPSDLDKKQAERIRRIIEGALDDIADVLVPGK